MTMALTPVAALQLDAGVGGGVCCAALECCGAVAVAADCTLHMLGWALTPLTPRTPRRDEEGGWGQAEEDREEEADDPVDRADSDDAGRDEDAACGGTYSLSQLAAARMPWGGAITALAASREFLVVAELLHSVMCHGVSWCVSHPLGRRGAPPLGGDDVVDKETKETRIIVASSSSSSSSRQTPPPAPYGRQLTSDNGQWADKEARRQLTGSVN